MQEEVYNHLLIEKEDERTYRSEHMLGDLGEIKDSVDLRQYCDPHNQGGTNHCTAYGATHVMEILNSIEHKMGIRLDPEENWANQLIYPATAHESYGDYQISAIKALEKFGLTEKHSSVTKTGKFTIDSYAVVYKTHETIRKHLSAKLPLFTGSRSISTTWSDAKISGWMEPYNGIAPTGGHIWALIGHNIVEDYYIGLNSYGPNWGKWGNGTFRIKSEDLFKLLGVYVLFDSSDIEKIFRDVTVKSPHATNIKRALDNGLLLGYDSENIEDPKQRFFMPEKNVTRAELATFAARLEDRIISLLK